MARFSLGLLGGFDLRPASGSTALAPGKKIQGLLAILGVRPGQIEPRDRLASLLWSDVDLEQARHSLRQALFSLRRLLRDDVLQTTAETVALDPEAVVVDVAEFERLAASAAPEALARAAALYRGEFVDGLRLREPGFEKWATAERERLRSHAITVFERLTEARVGAGTMDSAIEAAKRLLTVDPTREATHRLLMRLYLDTGRRTAAARQYHACERVLARELGLVPDAETRALYDAILKAGARATNGARPTRAAILLVEDEPVTRAVIERVVGQAGYDVTAVADGTDALAELGARHFDLILSDIALPTLDGLALADVVARKGLSTPIIFITGQPGDELEIKGLQSGALDFIRKPVQRDVLLLRVQKALRAV